MMRLGRRGVAASGVLHASIRVRAVQILTLAASGRGETLGEINAQYFAGGAVELDVAKKALAASLDAGNWREARAEAAQKLREGWIPPGYARAERVYHTMGRTEPAVFWNERKERTIMFWQISERTKRHPLSAAQIAALKLLSDGRARPAWGATTADYVAGSVAAALERRGLVRRSGAEGDAVGNVRLVYTITERGLEALERAEFRIAP